MTETPRPDPAPLALLEVDVTLPDIEAFNIHVGFSPRMRARWRRQFAMIYATALAGLIGWNLVTTGAEGFDWLLDLLVPVVTVVVVALVLTPLLHALHRRNLRRALRAMLGRAPRETYLGRKRIEATAEGIAITGGASHSFYGWAAVTGLQETPELILVMLGETMAVVVPKRDQAEPVLDTLRAAVRDHARNTATAL